MISEPVLSSRARPARVRAEHNNKHITTNILVARVQSVNLAPTWTPSTVVEGPGGKVTLLPRGNHGATRGKQGKQTTKTLQITANLTCTLETDHSAKDLIFSE